MNPGNALVRIAAKDPSTPIGTGFVFHQDSDRILILTSREVADSASKAGVVPEKPRTVWINGKYEAKWIFGDGKPDMRLAVLECDAQDLSDREPLPLREPLNPEKQARIAVY